MDNIIIPLIVALYLGGGLILHSLNKNRPYYAAPLDGIDYFMRGVIWLFSPIWVPIFTIGYICCGGE